jgi:hypothetical protein
MPPKPKNTEPESERDREKYSLLLPSPLHEAASFAATRNRTSIATIIREAMVKDDRVKQFLPEDFDLADYPWLR